MVITEFEFVNGLFSLILVITSTIVGLRIASRYSKFKSRLFLCMGLCWILIVTPWWPSAISFLVALITGQGLPLQIYIFIGNVGIPVFWVSLVTAYTDMKFQRRQKQLVSIFIIIGVIFYINLFYYLIVDPSALGELHGIIDIEYQGLLRYFLIFTVLVIFIIGTLIAIASMKSEDKEVKLKGKFLLIAFILFTIGAFSDAVLPLTVITLTIVRIILITCSAFFYLGFIPPNFIKNIFLKK